MKTRKPRKLTSCYVLFIVVGVFFLSFCATQDVDIPDDRDIPVVEGVYGNYPIIEEDDVLILTRETFTYFVRKYPLILVEFYAPWCGHCQSLAPEYSKAAKALKARNLVLAKVDASKEVELAKDHMITGFPTIVLFKDGVKYEDYTGSRTAQGIEDYMNQISDPTWKPPQSAVIVLTADNFTQISRKADLMLVEFYAPWCKHCKQLEPEYEGAARTLQQYGITLAKVDGPKEKSLADSMQIPGWPTLKVVRRGRVYEYKGPREEAGIVEHMKMLAKPPSVETKTVTEAQNQMDRYECTVAGFFDSKTDLYEEYIAAANEMRGFFNFWHTFNTDVIERYDIRPNTIVVFQPEIYHSEHEPKFFEFSKVSGTFKEIVEFVQKSSVPLVGQRTKINASFKYASRPLVVLYYDVNFSHQFVKDTQIIRKKIVEVAKDFRHTNLKFAISNEDEYEDELRDLGLAENNEDIKAAAFETKVKFRMEPVDDFEPEHLRDFLQNLVAGKVKPYYKSQPTPKTQKGPVRIIVANTFEDEVLKQKKDVLLELYAPWCGHCKALEPVFTKLAKKMAKENPNLVVSKMDATANDLHPTLGQIKGYPTIFFIPAFQKDEMVQFSGEHTYKALKEFVDEHASVFLTEEERLGLNKPTEQPDSVNVPKDEL